MRELSLPKVEFNIKREGDVSYIYDQIRKKHIVLTPEEWVRQHIVHYLLVHKQYPQSLMRLEQGFTLYKSARRADIICYNSKAEPLLLVECKAPDITISEQVFQQIAHYNIQLQAPYLFVSNGLQHYACAVNFESKSFEFLDEIPAYIDICN